MADYICSDTDLTSIADAIRTKGGTSAELVFPAEFVSAIANIPSGSTFPYEHEVGEFTATSAQASTDTITISYTGTHSEQPSAIFLWDTTDPTIWATNFIKCLMLFNGKGANVKPDATSGTIWGFYATYVGSTNFYGFTVSSGSFTQAQATNAFSATGMTAKINRAYLSQDHVYRWISIW